MVPYTAIGHVVEILTRELFSRTVQDLDRDDSECTSLLATIAILTRHKHSTSRVEL